MSKILTVDQYGRRVYGDARWETHLADRERAKVKLKLRRTGGKGTAARQPLSLPVRT